MDKYGKNYYRGKGLTFDYTNATATNFDTGETHHLKNTFVDAARIRASYFANWVNRELFPTKH
jgi:hypothetical protein